MFIPPFIYYSVLHKLLSVNLHITTVKQSVQVANKICLNPAFSLVAVFLLGLCIVVVMLHKN